MKKFIVIAVCWLMTIAMAHGAIPKAEIAVSALNANQWPAEFRLTLKVPSDHHAYLDAGLENIYLPVALDADAELPAAGLKIVNLQKPAGVFDEQVKATVLRGQGDFTFSLEPLKAEAPVASAVNLAVSYQLCNDLTHVCYRPQTAPVSLALPSVPVPAAASLGGDDSASIMDRLLALFKNNQHNTLLMFWLMFFAGLLSVATPCVYPMLPITSMFIVNRAGGVAAKEKLHALVYVVGIIGTYMILGLVAGMTGGAFNAFMQSALINIAFALFFAFFAVSLLGFYELAFMQNEVYSLDQRSGRVNGLGGTWLMGAVAGLVISPCVGPIVFALLLQVADAIANKSAALVAVGQQLSFWNKFGIAAQGSVMMGGFGLGVGLPFFLISVIKFKKLPKAGYWMNKIKYAFGLMILYFAYQYFAKGMGVLGVEPAVTQALALGMVAVWVAVVHCNVLSLVPTDAKPNDKMRHFCGVTSLIVGACLIVVGLGKTPIAAMAQASDLAVVNQQSENLLAQEEGGISWYRNFAAAQKTARELGKPIFIDFYASWCANCVAFKEEVAHNPKLNQVLREKAVAVKLVDKEPEFEKFRARPEHRQLKIGLPYFAILSSTGQLLWSGSDYQATAKMMSILLENQGSV